MYIHACICTFDCAPHPEYQVKRSCQWAGISGVVSVCVSAHPVEPRFVNVHEFLPTGTLPRKSGRLNVVEPSHAQYSVLVIAKSAE